MHAATLRKAFSSDHKPGRLRKRLAYFGPAFVASVAYIDPGNFATNISGGAKFGYLLVWVIVMANAMAMLVQYLSAKTGLATGKNLPELCREHFPRPVSFGLWVQAEVVAIATDLAEFVGAAIALNLLFGLAPLTSGFITAVVAFGILALQTRGYRRFELVIGGMLAIVLIGFLVDLMKVDVDGGAALGGLIPKFSGTQSILLAVGILGATVMPHVVYLHSALTTDRTKTNDDDEKRKVLRFQRTDVFVALGIAGVINLSMLLIAASVFHDTGRTNVETIESAHAGFESLLGGGAALAFGIALLASGLSSSSVGTFAGQVVMQGFIQRRIPVFLRRGPDDGAVARRARPRRQHHRRAGHLPGGAVVRHPVRADPHDPAHPPRRRDGGARQPAQDHGDRQPGRHRDRRAEPVPDLRHLLRMSTAAIEDYAKAIYALEERADDAVTTTALAERLEVTPGSVSAMLKKLDAAGLVSHEPYRGVRLTPAGRRVALEVIRHHRLIELFLAEVLDMPWDRVHAEAEVLEHVLSEELEGLIAEKLGHPTCDPHGDPIPSADLELTEARRGVPLESLEPGATGRFLRVSDADPEMLRWLAEREVRPGDEVAVLDKQPFAGPLTVRVGEAVHVLGGGVAAAMRIELS